ncbi:hypothetical protein JCM19238_2258 [Vibrio ponticus]|nr:hypothetical protein JCM19238_2258 [Vibrio ponticus]
MLVVPEATSAPETITTISPFLPNQKLERTLYRFCRNHQCCRLNQQELGEHL